MDVTLFFQFSFVWWCLMNHKHKALWSLKNYKLYTMCTLILSNPLHLTVGSKWILTQNELWVQKCCCANSKVFWLVFRITKGCHQNFSLLCTIILVRHHLFWNGSPLMCFHPIDLFYTWLAWEACIELLNMHLSL
jgi:hypothetical protein